MAVTVPSPAWWAPLLPIATFLGGYIAKAVADWMQDARSTAREREGRRAARRDQVLQRRADFQRENLLELQDALAVLARSVGKLTHHDEMAFKTSGVWGGTLAPEGDDEKFRKTLVDTGVRSSRIRDPEVRKLTNQVRQLCTDAAMAKSPEMSRGKFAEMALKQDELNRLIGAVLMTLEDETLKEAEDWIGR